MNKFGTVKMMDNRLVSCLFPYQGECNGSSLPRKLCVRNGSLYELDSMCSSLKKGQKRKRIIFIIKKRNGPHFSKGTILSSETKERLIRA